MKKYQIIYADPPWTYKDKALAGLRGAGCKYSTMSLNAIKNLPIKNIADNNCILFLWVTMPKLNECFSVIDAWGFKYKTVGFTWVKQNKKELTWFWGMGRWTRANAEVCLIATKGKPKRINAGVHSIIDTPIQAHSQKPNEVRSRIVQLMGDLPRIELFAREKTPGWVSVGYDIDGMDIRESLDKLMDDYK